MRQKVDRHSFTLHVSTIVNRVRHISQFSVRRGNFSSYCALKLYCYRGLPVLKWNKLSEGHEIKLDDKGRATAALLGTGASDRN